MTKSILLVAVLWIAPAAFGFGTTYVSRSGTDSVYCGVTYSPCYSLGAALANTDTGGIVKIMDTYALAPTGITITRPVTIDGSGFGVIENIFAPGSPAIQISANATIRNLVIQVSSGDGILISANNAEVHLENIQIAGTMLSFTNGVHVTGSGVNLTADGLTVIDSATGVNLVGANVTFAGSGLRLFGSTSTGFSIAGGSGTLRDGLIRGPGAGGSGTGLRLSGGAVLSLDRCELTANGTGVLADGSAGTSTLRLNNSTVAGNGTGLSAVGAGQIISLRTNVIAGNGSDGTPPLSTSLK